jgi:carbonic anhydrase
MEAAAGPTSAPTHFTYDPFDEEAGPSTWAKNFPTSQCAGTSQSPVQLPNYANAKADNTLKPLSPSYAIPANTVLSLRNTGHALQINMPTGLTLQGGALGANPYNVVQMHMHGQSEHAVAGAHYPLEFHIVHSDPTRNGTTDPRALAVLGIMVAESPDNVDNAALTPLVSLLPNFTTPLNNFNASAVITQPFSLTSLLPTNMDYYHYNGSLTTPPCSEQVVWHVLTTPILASRAQILALTAPFGAVGNSRPTQPLNGRSVAVTSFNTPTSTPTSTPTTSSPTTSSFGASQNITCKNGASTLSMTLAGVMSMIGAMIANMQ